MRPLKLAIAAAAGFFLFKQFSGPKAPVAGAKKIASADFDTDNKTETVWRAPNGDVIYLDDDGHSATLLRAVPDQTWQVATVQGKRILWANSDTGQTYYYELNGPQIAAEGYVN